MARACRLPGEYREGEPHGAVRVSGRKPPTGRRKEPGEQLPRNVTIRLHRLVLIVLIVLVLIVLAIAIAIALILVATANTMAIATICLGAFGAFGGCYSLPLSCLGNRGASFGAFGAFGAFGGGCCGLTLSNHVPYLR